MAWVLLASTRTFGRGSCLQQASLRRVVEVRNTLTARWIASMYATVGVKRTN